MLVQRLELYQQGGFKLRLCIYTVCKIDLRSLAIGIGIGTVQ